MYNQFELDTNNNTLYYWGENNSDKQQVPQKSKGRGRFDQAVYWYLPDGKSYFSYSIVLRKNERQINIFAKVLQKDKEDDFKFYKKSFPCQEIITNIDFQEVDEVEKNEKGRWVLKKETKLETVWH